MAALLSTHCVQEFELLSSPWGRDLGPVVATLQALLEHGDTGPASKVTGGPEQQLGQGRYLQNLDEQKTKIMGKLPLGKRLALKYLLPLAHSCVANREATKSMLIK